MNSETQTPGPPFRELVQAADQLDSRTIHERLQEIARERVYLLALIRVVKRRERVAQVTSSGT